MENILDDNLEVIAAATFDCSVCGEAAANVAIFRVKAGRTSSMLESAHTKVVVSGFLWGYASWTERSDPHALVKAVNSGSASAVYDLDEEWAPFYCPECDRSYCKNHWFVNIEFDDDFPGWYDCAYGTCPEGHRRMIDD